MIQNRYNTKLLNGYNDPSVCYTLLGVVIAVHEEKYAVDVYIPKSNTNMYNVQIGTSIVGEGAGVNILPSLNQKCIILLSTMHHPILIAIIPNQRQEFKNLLLSGEAKIGSSEAFMKLSKDNTIGFRTGESALSIDGGNIEDISFSSRKLSPYLSCKNGYTSSGEGYSIEKVLHGVSLDTFIPKKDIVLGREINEEIKSQILESNTQLITTLSNLVSEVSMFNENTEMMGENTIDELESLRQSINEIVSIPSQEMLVSEYGSTDFNASNDATMSIRGYNNGSESYSVLFKADGTIDINCKDITINKAGGNENDKS